MDAVKFLQERSRMYKSGAVTPGYDYDPIMAVKIVEEWSAAHPRKTRQSVFLEQYPNVKHIDNIVAICPKVIDISFSCPIEGNIDIDCSDCLREFWMQEVE